eukprot:CAMPEP_0171760378 /NCGR_PEP_ID=MMETSP0991-20121206/47438_1 /TAXON_ID=483369 /ORGANISM="non described non described, Strain CCMP2098" /LENGTH=120 /DNA_ID=CAMNT_0012363465 /DNA_START=385 /DNA_END=745 /DNA_ORIENTATION=+
MSTLALGSSLERSVGTTQMVFIVLWQILGCGAISVAASWALSMVLLNDLSYLKQHSVGFSGVIFALAVVDIYRNSSTTHRSVMGVFSVQQGSSHRASGPHPERVFHGAFEWHPLWNYPGP